MRRGVWKLETNSVKKAQMKKKALNDPQTAPTKNPNGKLGDYEPKVQSSWRKWVDKRTKTWIHKGEGPIKQQVPEGEKS